jgi:hypothetical protein
MPKSPESVIEAGSVYSLSNGEVRPRYSTLGGNTHAVIECEKTLTVYGLIAYGDLFGSPDRTLKFCKRLEIEPTSEGEFYWFEECENQKYTL